MTWGKAVPVLAICLVFDAGRFLFEQFWLFGPIFIAAGTDAAVGGGLTGKIVGGAVGLATRIPLVSGGLEVFGVVMAMAVGLLGWLTIGTLLMLTNSRIFKENGFWFVASLAISVAPIIGTIPALVVITWRMYHHQIKKEKAALKKYNEEQTATQAEERQQRLTEFAEARIAQAEAQQEEEIPDEMPLVA